MPPFESGDNATNGFLVSRRHLVFAAIAQLGERQTEDLKVPGSIPGGGNWIFFFLVRQLLIFASEVVWRKLQSLW